MSTPRKVELNATQDSVVDTVTVYTDRAEVTRLFQGLKLEEGQTEVAIIGVVDLVQDSLRVEGRGKGCSILDVTYTVKYVHQSRFSGRSSEDEDAEAEAGRTAKKTMEIEKLKKQLEELEDKKAVLHKEQARILKQQALLDSYGENLKPRSNVTTAAVSTSSPSPPGPLHPESLTGLTAFLSLHSTSSAELDARLHTIAKTLKDIDAEMEVVRKNLDEVAGVSASEDTAVRTVTVLVETHADVEAQLSVTYVVYNASWSPFYDLRVLSDVQKLSINYRAEIKQSTGEDWKDTSIALSTATPALGGDSPTPTRWTISLAPKYVYRSSEFAKTKSASPFRKEVRSSLSASASDMVNPAPQGYIPTAYSTSLAEPMAMVTATVESGLTTATYKVAARSTLPSDNIAHKVTVAIIELSPKFLHFAYPRAGDYVYLKAKVKNDSEYSLLPGPASVFLDNNFVAKSSLNNVSPQETFECSLGVDPSIRVTRRAAIKTTETSGLISKSEMLRFTQVIEVKNTKTASAKIVVVDQVPWSGDEKLRVTLVDPPQPSIVVAGDTPGERRVVTRKDGPVVVTRDEEIELRDGEVQTRLNTDTNCLEWVAKIAPGKSTLLKFIYSVQYPHGESVSGMW
ncbi:hypothetical protein HDU93_002125 [Gonapodya sp. JEL0774]|nr:hypothetical protein HDU93_002125 [Gonapodya sp. JEL0774]